MNKEQIYALIDDAGHIRKPVESVVSQFNSLEELNDACEYCKTKISRAYRESTDIGDMYAKILMMVKIHAINNLNDRDKMTFISEL